MQHIAYKFAVVAILLSAWFICACSTSDDPLDETGWRWAITDSATVNDGGEESDVIDLLSGENASISLTVSSREDNDAFLFIHTIECEIIPLDDNSAAVGGNSPPVLGAITYSPGGWIDPNGGSIAFDLGILSVGGKLYYYDTIGGDTPWTGGFWASYYVDITIHGSFSSEDLDNDITLYEDAVFTITAPEEEEEE